MTTGLTTAEAMFIGFVFGFFLMALGFIVSSMGDK